MRRSSILPCLLVLLPFSSFAQKPTLHDDLIQFTGTIDAEAHKAILSALNAQDPDILMSVSVIAAQAKVRTHAPLSQEQLAIDLAPYGIGVQWILVGEPGVGALRAMDDPDAGGFPQYVDTGNPAADDATYEAAKQIWLATHPAYVPGPPSIIKQ